MQKNPVQSVSQNPEVSPDSDIVKKYHRLKTTLVIFLILMAVSGAVAAGYYFGTREKQESVTEETILPSPSIPTDTQLPTSPPKAFEDAQVAYLAAPLKLGKLGFMQTLLDAKLISLATPEGKKYDLEENSTYYKIGIMKDAKYSGRDLILVESKDYPPDGPGGTYDAINRFIDLGGGNFVFLGSHSDIYLDDYEKQIPSEIKIDKEFKINSLTRKYNVIFPANGQEFYFAFNGYEIGIPPNANKIGEIEKKGFYRENRVISGKQIFKNVGRRISYYLEMPDKTVAVYNLSSSHISSFPQIFYPLTSEGEVDYDKKTAAPEAFLINWSDNPKIKPISGSFDKDTIRYNEYSYSDLFGNILGFKYYDQEIDLGKNLKQIGENKAGEKFYVLNDLAHPILKEFYEKRNEELSSVKDMSYQEFLGATPVFFWKDVWGDFHALFRGDLEKVMGIAKPAVYLYPEREMIVNVQVDNKLQNAIFIPDYSGSWQVKAAPSGEITVNDKTYDYLFYEGDKKDFKFSFSTKPDVVRQENIKKYLGEKLASFGLNQKETAQFTEFWEPKMKGKHYYRISFMMTDDLQKQIPLYVWPAPDTLVRILMKFEGLNRAEEKFNIEDFAPERKGFTVVEWGGMK